MYCTHCGQETPENANYCSACGWVTPAGEAVRQASGYAPRRLFRLPYDKKIAGICSGIAKYLDVDVTMVRIFVVAIACVTGFVPGIIAYLIAWFIMPVESELPRLAGGEQPAHAK